MPLSTEFITVCESKRTSFERAFTHWTYVYSGINSYTARHNSSECHRQTLGAGCHLPKRHKQTSVFL